MEWVRKCSLLKLGSCSWQLPWGGLCAVWPACLFGWFWLWIKASGEACPLDRLPYHKSSHLTFVSFFIVSLSVWAVSSMRSEPVSHGSIALQPWSAQLLVQMAADTPLMNGWARAILELSWEALHVTCGWKIESLVFLLNALQDGCPSILLPCPLYRQECSPFRDLSLYQYKVVLIITSISLKMK